MTVNAAPGIRPVETQSNRAIQVSTVGQMLDALEHRSDHSPRLTPLPTGFDPLDRILDGGVRAHDLFLVGGAPGVGKTIATLQWARHLADQGQTAIYACYEHDQTVLLARLLSLELSSAAGSAHALEIEKWRSILNDFAMGGCRLRDVLGSAELIRTAYEQIESYRDRLWLCRASGAHTGLAELEQLVATHGSGPTTLFVDYLQKIAVQPEPNSEAEKVLRTAEGLKDLALSHDVAIVAVVAADQLGLEARRLRLHHLRGSSALAYESDIVVMLNDKMQCVSKVHLAYDPVRAETFRHSVVFSVEKNRGGPALVDVEFRKDFANYRFDPLGGYVSERLVDERLYSE